MRTLVVGAGAAGLWCALHAAERGPVVVVAPGLATQSATAWAQGGIAAVIDEGDDPALHAADTLRAGDGLSDPDAVALLTSEAPGAIQELLALGMTFDDAGAPTLEGGHSARRVLHAGGDASGRALLQLLTARVDIDRRIEWLHARAASVAIEGGAARGVVLDDGRHVEADRVVLATGGATGIFGRRTGPASSIGAGMRLAWGAGAALADLEFVQFHPTALDVAGRPARLFTEALRGEGAILVDARRDRFMPSFDGRAELAPRDVVARAVDEVRTRTHEPVYLDATGVPDVETRFPVAAAQCREVGLDLSRDAVPVAPAAHYFMGGVLTDAWGRTSVPDLFACGETACTGVHGANRLASNSLAEALVYGRRAALADRSASRPGDADRLAFGVPRRSESESPGTTSRPGAVGLDEVRDVADRFLGVRRSGEGLARAIEQLSAEPVKPGRSIPVGANDPIASLVAWLLASAALRREESRGGHWRADFPHRDDERWRVRQVVDPLGWRLVAVPSRDAPLSTPAPSP